jgi:hypothetical protein
LQPSLETADRRKGLPSKDGKELTGLGGTTPGLGNKNAGEMEKRIACFSQDRIFSNATT